MMVLTLVGVLLVAWEVASLGLLGAGLECFAEEVAVASFVVGAFNLETEALGVFLAVEAGRWDEHVSFLFG